MNLQQTMRNQATVDSILINIKGKPKTSVCGLCNVVLKLLCLFRADVL
jgi:glutaredoxin-related protein